MTALAFIYFIQLARRCTSKFMPHVSVHNLTIFGAVSPPKWRVCIVTVLVSIQRNGSLRTILTSVQIVPLIAHLGKFMVFVLRGGSHARIPKRQGLVCHFVPSNRFALTTLASRICVVSVRPVSGPDLIFVAHRSSLHRSRTEFLFNFESFVVSDT